MHKEIGDLSQGTTSVSTYFSHLTDLWDEFESIIPIPGCDYPRSRPFMEYLGLQKTMKFLMGFNDTYSPQRSQILMMDPTPSLNQVYSMIIHEESQLNGSSGTLRSGSMEGLITANASHYRSNTYNNSLYCTYCHKQGHVKEFCHRLIGYPPNFQFTNNRRPQGNPNSSTSFGNSSNTGNSLGEGITATTTLQNRDRGSITTMVTALQDRGSITMMDKLTIMQDTKEKTQRIEVMLMLVNHQPTMPMFLVVQQHNHHRNPFQ